MSDVLILGLATIISGSVITPVVAWLIRRSEKKILDKVEEHRKEINGRMGELLETTKNLGHAEGMAEEKEKTK